MSPSDPNFHRLTDWEHRAAVILDSNHPEIQTFFSRVVPVVQGTLGNVLQSMSTRFSGEQRAMEGAIQSAERSLRRAARRFFSPEPGFPV